MVGVTAVDDKVGVTGAVSNSLSGFREVSFSPSIDEDRKDGAVMVSTGDAPPVGAKGSSDEAGAAPTVSGSGAPMKSPLRRFEKSCEALKLIPTPLKGTVGSKSSTRAACLITFGGGLLR